MTKTATPVKTALITGISGSGGSYLAEYIVNNHPNVDVQGLSRWHSTVSRNNLRAISNKVTVHECDLNDMSSVLAALDDARPNYIFHLASHANVQTSFSTPISVVQNNVTGTLILLEAVRYLKIKPKIQICSTSEVYGQVHQTNVPINEDCPLNPSSPYAVSKLAQDLLGATYFRSYGMEVIRTRMFSYLNPRRSDLFATSFATQIARIEMGLQSELHHGNLESVRTLIDVRDAMQSYWIATLKGRPGEVYNIGGSKVIKVGEFLEILKGMATCKIKTVADPALFRPVDVTLQIPDVTKFTNETGWKPKYSFEESVQYLLNHVRKEVKGRNAVGL